MVDIMTFMKNSFKMANIMTFMNNSYKWLIFIFIQTFKYMAISSAVSVK